jgi:hypothetical protein
MKTWKSLALCLLLTALWGTASWSPSAVAGKVCSLQACTGTGFCSCPNGQTGHCVNGACTL